MGFSGRSGDGAGVVKVSMFWIDWVDARGVNLARRLTERETWGCQKQKLYADTQGEILELAMWLLIGGVRVFV